MRLAKITGFTLIEVMVVTVAATLMMLAITSATISSLSVSNKAENLSVIEQEGQFIMAQIKDALLNTNAESMVCTDYQFVVSTGNVTNSMRAPITATSTKDGGVTRFTCRQSGSTYYIASDSASQGSGNVTIKLMGNQTYLERGCRGFVVSCGTQINPVVSVGITLSVGTSGGSSFYASKSFFEKFVIRD